MGWADDSRISIVAAHGLNIFNDKDHGEDTWRSPTSGKSWLRDFLPSQISTARIFLYGYNANVASSTTRDGIHEVASNLNSRLLNYRENDPDRPLLFICHGLGGLVVKRVSHDVAELCPNFSTDPQFYLGSGPG